MMVVTESPETDSPILVPVSYGASRSSKIAVWAGVLAFSAAAWAGIIVAAVRFLS